MTPFVSFERLPQLSGLHAADVSTEDWPTAYDVDRPDAQPPPRLTWTRRDRIWASLTDR